MLSLCVCVTLLCAYVYVLYLCVYVCVYKYMCCLCVYMCVCVSVYVRMLSVYLVAVCMCVHLRHRKAGCGNNISHPWVGMGPFRGNQAPLHGTPHPTYTSLLPILSQVSFYKPRGGVIEPLSADTAQSLGSMAPRTEEKTPGNGMKASLHKSTGH